MSRITWRDSRFAKGMLWRNKKTGGLYFTDGGGINTTNAQDGTIMIRYFDRRDYLLRYTPFYREVTEFLEKFEPALDEKGICKIE